MVSAQTNRPLNECPKNVKEALEWLEALGSGASHCANVIQSKILGSQNGHTINGSVDSVCQKATEFMTAIKNGNGYTSSYQQNGWSQLCQSQTGKQCCATTGHGPGCRECTSSSTGCHGCCKNCPQQICARIFCLIVPVVYSALQCLYSMVAQNGYYSNDNLQAYLRALGFNNQGQYNTQQIITQVQQALQRQQQPPQNGTLLGALHSATVQIKSALQGSQHSLVDGQSAGSSGSHYSTTTHLTTPTSAKDLMLWTIFLPYCCNYQGVYMMLSQVGLVKNGEGSPGAQGPGSPYSSPLEGLVYGLHLLFIGMEYGGHALSSSSHSSPSSHPLQPPRTLFDGIEMISHGLAPYEYYTSGSSVSSSSYDGSTQCLKLLIAGIPIISSAVEMLLWKNGSTAQGGNHYGLEQHLGFGTGMQQLSPTLGQQLLPYVHSTLDGIKSAYGSNGFQGLSSNGTTSQTYSSTTPTTFREMLLWLQGLPCSGGYHEVRTLLTSADSSPKSGTTTGTTTDPLVGIIFNLPQLFYHLEGMNTSTQENRVSQSNGTMTGYITELFQSQGIQVNRGNGTRSSKGPTASAATPFLYSSADIKKTFCAIVTIVYYVVDHLKRKHNGAGSSYGIGDSSGLLEFLGWRDNTQGGTMTSNGSYLNSVLQLCFGNGNSAATLSTTNGNYLSQLFQKVRDRLSNGSITTAATTSSAPTTFRETLLCLVGAPLTQGYDSVKGQLATAVQSSHSSSTDIENNIADTIVGVLQLFNKLEGSILSAILGVFTEGASVSLKYNYSGTSGATNGVVGTICGATVVMRSVFGFLQQRCNGTVGLGAGTPGDSSNDSWQSCSVTCANGGKQASSTTQCQAGSHLCKFLCLLGWDHKTRGAQSTTTTPTLNGTAFHDLLLKCFGSLDTTGQGVSSYTLGQSSAPSLKALYDCAVQWFQKETGTGTTPSSATTSTTTKAPTTIREMMLWLIGLPLHSVYKALTDSNGTTGGDSVIKKKLESLNSRSSGVRNSFSIGTYSQLSNSSQITNAIVSSSQGMIITMLAIEGNIKSVWEFLTKGLKTDSNTLSYGSGSDSGSKTSDSDPDACLELLVDYTYKVHYQLRFLLTMCNTDRTNGGWKDCEYGNATGQCKCSDTLKTSCLKKFLEDNSNGINTSTTANGENKFVGPAENGNLGMGFFNGTHITTSNGKLTGSDIHALLKYYVDTATEYNRNMSTASLRPLSLLAQCIVAIGQRGPSTLGDCFELLWQLGYGDLRSYVDGKLKAELKDVTWEVTGDNRNKDAGTALITAIQNLFSNHSTGSSSSNHGSSLGSLMCSQNGGSNGCAPYMKSLSQGVYHYYLPDVMHAGDSTKFGVFQYLYDMLRKLLDKMKALKEAFDKCECCTTGSKTPCTGLISCPNAHPILYRFGFVFGNPGSLKSGNKTCNTLKDQLTKVLSCQQKSESALFKAFERVIQVTYKVLLEKAKGCVTTKYKTNNGKTTTDGLQSTKTEMNTAFTLYVHNAMYQSYPKLICTFACKVFDSGHNCNDDCKTRFKEKIAEPDKKIPDPTKKSIDPVSPSAVTTITAVIPSYTAPVIDPYHYKVFQKATATESEGTSGTSTHYSFRDAIDFHVQGAQCISPAPVALRSVIDWILRITVGVTDKDKSKDENNNDNIKALCDAIKSVLGSGVSVDEVEKHIVSLVKGLRTFMGYQDKSGDVISKVGEALGTNGNGVKKLLDAEIQKINEFIGQEGSKNFASELGKALLKGRYHVQSNGVIGALFDAADWVMNVIDVVVKGDVKRGRTFAEVVTILQNCLTHNHTCQTGLKCNEFKGTDSSSKSDSQSTSSNGPTAQGLSDLYTFFSKLNTFAALWNTIGMKTGTSQNPNPSSSVVHNQKNAAATEVSKKCNGSSSSNNDYFTNLYKALNALGQCADKVEKLNKNNGSENSQQYRTKITELIKHLKDEVLSRLKDEKDTGNNNGSDPQYAVKGAEKLIEETKKGVEEHITRNLILLFTKVYDGELDGEKQICKFSQNGADSIHSTHPKAQQFLCIQSLIIQLQVAISINTSEFKSHLDDLKQLCQWLYRMGQLYAHGLKGFVESLISHLQYIYQLIVWIEALRNHLKIILGCSNIRVDKTEGFFSDFNRFIGSLLASYAIDDERIKFLSEIRLLALDRYTLQVWQDECNKKGDCRIKNWITFENGIVRHSNLNAIKEALKDLTGIAYSSNTTTVASPPATPSASRSRIHDFHAICVIQKFSYEAPIAELERSLEKLKGIQGQLSAVKGKCNTQTDVSSDGVVTSFCDSVSQFLKDPYGIYSFAKFVHTIMGPNVFSAVIGALEDLKDTEKYKNANGGNLDKIKGILGVLAEGLEGENGQMNNDYKLEEIITKLTEFITTLRKEYIFAYPVVTATASLAAVPQADSQSKTPKCENDDHSKASICSRCYPFLARIFIGSIPNLYRHCRLLYEMCDIEPGYSQKKILSMGYEDYYNRYMLSLSVYMSHQGYEVLTRDKDGVMHPNAFKHELNPTMPGTDIFEKLKDIVSLKDPLTTTTDSSLMPLEKLFKAVMQHFKKERDEKKTQREQELEEKFNQKHKDSGLMFQAPPAPLPSTVRQVLFWLHELDTKGEFYKKLCDHIFTLCKQSSIQIYDGVITHLLRLSATQCLEVLATIEDPGRQNADYYYDLYTEEHYYDYPTVNIPLFFYTFVEKLMAAFLELNFVCVQCEFRATEGGWSECHIGKSEHSMNGQNCRCTKSHITVSTVLPALVDGSVVCPRPLYSFLFSDQKNQLRIPSDVSQRLAYMSKGTMPCGFKLKNKASTDPATPSPAHTPTPTPTPTPTSVSGSVLLEPLRKLVGGHVTGRLKDTSTTNGLNTLSTVIYLRDLLRYTLCLAVRPPWSMSENMAFFYRVTESWKKDQVHTGVRVAHHNAKLLGAIHAEIALFPGTFDGKKLTSAVERFAGIEDNNKHQNSAASPQSSHQFDLKTLMGCQELNTSGTSAATGTTVQCSPFMFPLSLDVYTHYDHKNSRAYLSWILNFAFGIYGELRGLEEMIKESACVMKNASQSTPSSCPSLPMCPGVLSALYQSGSSFMDQGKLAEQNNGNKKTCAQFRDVLSGLFNCDSTYCTPLHNLILQCEAFLWSIRMPFSLVQLSLWSVALLFISYVFVVPLDHFKIKSHLFNRLKYTMHPSLLIADQQRRVSEVAYFSL